MGYEIILKAFAEQTMFEVCTPVVFGSAKIGSYHRKALGIETQFHFVNSAKDAVDGRLNLVNCFDNDVNVEFGRTSQEAGRAAYWALEAATEALKNGEIDVLVTAPICKTPFKVLTSILPDTRNIWPTESERATNRSWFSPTT